jgi:hypothetical protein
MRFEEALAELRKDPDHSRMAKSTYYSRTGYVIREGRLCFFDGKNYDSKLLPQIKGSDYLAEDWEVKTDYCSGVEALEAYKQGKWISHKDWNGGYYNIHHALKGSGCLCYTSDILKQLSDNLWLIKDSI